MNCNLMWRAGLALSFACVSLFSVGCAQQVGDIDRTQPNKLKKSDFDWNTEYYYRQQITDTDMQGSFAFQGLYGDMKRIRWEITENTLFACSTVPSVQGQRAEDAYINGRECFGVVAAFPIQGHFDVQRQYNSATGEQMNVISENMSDRPWYDREYFRVDWSRNMIDYSVNFGSFVYQFQPSDYGSLSSASWNPNQDPGPDAYVDPLRTRIEHGEETIEYLETTTVFHTDPDYDACYYLNGQYFANCDGGRIAVTHSFSQVPEEKTFEPFLLRDNEFVLDSDSAKEILVTTAYDAGAGTYVQVECTDEVNERVFEEEGLTPQENCRPLTFDYFTRFGYFRTENHVYDVNYGLYEEGRQYYANHYNIWQTAYDADGNLLPAAERTPKPIVYYLNAEYPQDLIGAAKEVERQWDLAFLETVMISKGLDSLDAVRDELEAEYGDRRMFKIEENLCMPSKMAPWLNEKSGAMDGDRGDVMDAVNHFLETSEVQSGTLEEKLWGISIDGRRQLCARVEYLTELRENPEDRFQWEREGDLRKSFFSFVEEDNPGWLGYGPSSADPLTGEIVSGSAHMAGTLMRNYATTAADRIRYLNGELEVDDFSNGAHIREYIAQVRANTAETMSQGLTPEGKRELNGRSRNGVTTAIPTNFDRLPDVKDLPEFMVKNTPNQIKNQAISMSRAAVRARQEDTRITDFMNMPQVKSLMLADPKMEMTVEAIARSKAGARSVDQDDLDLAYMELYSPEIIHWREQERARLLGAHSMFTARDGDRAVDSLITYTGVADYFKGKSREEIAQYFLEKMFVGTQLHEVGHTVGLRHNFNSSMDALNYHNEYWLIQKAVLEGVITQEEANSVPLDKAKEFLTSKNIEDDDVRYLNETEFRLGSVMDYTGDLTGRFAGLGKYDHAAINFVYGRHIQTWKPEVAAVLPDFFDNRYFLASYKELPELLSGLPATEDQKTRQLAGIENILNGRQWVPIEDAVADLRGGIKDNTDKFAAKSFDENTMPYQNVVVPYNFCSDEYRDFQLGCDVFDWGSTHREIVNHYFNTYRILQPFYRYRRGRIHNNWETVNNYGNFLINTLFSSARAFRYFSFYRFWDLGSYTDDLREAAIDAANFYSEVLATPEPGAYCKFDEDADELRWDSNWYFNVQDTYLPASASYSQGQCDDRIIINQGPGQFYNYDLTDEYSYRVNYVGTFIDKLYASQLLFYISANNLYNNFLTDTRATNISYWTLFKDELHGLVRGMLLNDYGEFGGVYNNTQGTTGVYQAPLMVDRNAFTFGVPKKQDGMPRIFSPVSFNHEFNMLAYAMISNSTWQDREVDFAQYVRIGVGAREIMDFEGAEEIVEFENPSTGQTYAAPQMPDGKSISVEMLQWANTLKGRWTQAVADVEQQKSQYDKLREAYSASFNPNVCGIDFYDLDNNVALSAEEKAEVEAQLGSIGDPELQALCSSLVQYKQATASEQIFSDQLQSVTAQLDLLRWLRGILGPDALN